MKSIWYDKRFTPKQLLESGKFDRTATGNSLHNLIDCLNWFHGLSLRDVDLVEVDGGTQVCKKVGV